MTCEECEKAQDKGHAYFYRWKNSNILLSGCKKHIGEIMKELNEKVNNKIDK